MACSFPFYIKNPAFPAKSRERFVPCPCGKCPSCVTRRTDSWIFRLQEHQKVQDNSHFVTLTYSTEYVPISPRGYLTLCKSDFQLFVKRLRDLHKYNIMSKISYYAVGEYGSTTFRPHFHAIMFNVVPELIQKAWHLGDIHLGDVKGDSIAYTTKYISKGRVIPVHKNDDRVPEFSLMSKKMGLNYLTEEVKKWHNDDISRNYIVTQGKKIALPRYYRDRIFSEETRTKQGHYIRAQADQAEKEREREFVERTGNPDDYVRAKFESKKAELENFRKRSTQNRNKI